VGAFQTFVDWFSGGANQYHTLLHCMNGDTFWIATTVSLDLLVAVGYVIIAFHWWQNQKILPPGSAKKALAGMRNIFVFCGICGYLFIPVKVFWPAWRLYDIFLVLLVYSTWRYALESRQMRVIYSELGKSSKLAEDLRQSREESRKKGFFLNAVSHDLRTPLNALSLQAGLLEMQITHGSADGVREIAGEIKANARVAGELLDLLLEYARINESSEKNALREVSLNELLTDSAGTFHSAATEKGLTLDVHVPAELSVRTDPLKLDRILRNLVANAIKFTPAGGITIRAHEAPGDRVIIEVVDTGIGIAPEHHARLFDDFFQVANIERDRRKGFGLGLAIARQLARQLGGDIACQSIEGRGSIFSLELPIAPAAGDAALAEPARSVSLAAN